MPLPHQLSSDDMLGQLIRKAKALQVKPTQVLTMVAHLNGESVLIVIAPGAAAVNAQLQAMHVLSEVGMVSIDPRSGSFADMKV